MRQSVHSASVRSIQRLDAPPAPAQPPGYAPPGYAPPGYAPPAAPAPTVVVIQQQQPYAPAAPQGPRYEAYSPELARGGQAMVGLGIAGLVAGVVLLPYGISYRAANTCHSPAEDLHFKCEYGNGSAMVNGGIVALSLGGALTIAGAIMHRVGITPHRAEVSTAVPDVNVGSRGATLTWAF